MSEQPRQEGFIDPERAKEAFDHVPSKKPERVTVILLDRLISPGKAYYEALRTAERADQEPTDAA